MLLFLVLLNVFNKGVKMNNKYNKYNGILFLIIFVYLILGNFYSFSSKLNSDPYNYVIENLGISADRIIAMGRSLGGAAAVDLASRNPVAGLILESTFTSAIRVVTQVPVLPFDRFINIRKIKKIHCPVLIIHGTDDEVISFSHGRKLFEKANEPKINLWIEGADHNQMLSLYAGKKYWEAFDKFTELIEMQIEFTGQ